MDWTEFFDNFFSQRATELAVIFDAGGCRHGWVQGEMFLEGKGLAIKIDATASRFDLLCSAPPMIAEIRLCGGGETNAAKMWAWIEADVQKLAHAKGEYERFFILVIDNRWPDTPLGQWLRTCDFPNIRKREKPLSESVTIKMWQIEKKR
jgi:hypothetical protein